MRGPIANPLYLDMLKAAQQLIMAIVSWLVFWPIIKIVPRKKGLVAVLGRSGFSDNSKHFFAHTAYSSSIDAVFLAKDADILKAIQSAGGKALIHPSIRSMLCLIRCQYLVSDVSDWYNYGVYPLTSGAKRVQMWHGVPLKLIELADYRERIADISMLQRYLLWLYKTVIGRYPTYDLVISTSSWVSDNAFKSSFRSRRIEAFGYPRNDVLLSNHMSSEITLKLLELNVDQQLRESIREAKTDEKLCCLYAPTFRRSLRSPFDEYLNLEEISKFSKEHDILFIIKLHPFVKQKISCDLSNMVFCGSSTDIYPLLRDIDILITDYSSIYFDFLLLNRPMLFFPYDLDDYLKKDRSMYFEYSQITPGPKCLTQRMLLTHLAMLKNSLDNDEYADSRLKLRSLIHDHHDALASVRLAAFCAGYEDSKV